MRASDWQRLSLLLDELTDLPAAEREARLATVPPDLIEPLRRMLADLPESGPTAASSIFGFQHQLAGALAGPPVNAPKPGDRFGAWCLAELLGEGGMGQVWRAERADGLYQGEAAIKLLRNDVAGAGLAARFARERVLLGRLAHAGIARLLDAGEQNGLAFLVLEYVAGQGLSDHVRGRPLAERVRLLVSIAGAVEYAHAQLIVHRDLKPSNVVVDEHGSPKLLDFGIAGLLDDSGQQADNALTQITGRRLTPAYAAPEQITGGAIGVAADIYSLGVMLHELATGRLPFGKRGQSRTALEHAVVHGEAQRLRQTLDRVEDTASIEQGPGRPPDAHRAAGDLEAVVAKALRKNPAERYASVGALVDDLQRWLAQRPVSVRAEDWRHRAHLWARRNAAVALGGGLVIAALTAGMSVALWQRSEARAAAHRAELVTGYLSEVLSAASPDQNAGRQPTVIELLDRKRQELAERFNDEPEVKDRVYDTLGKTYFALQRLGVAAKLGQDRLAHARARFGDEDPRTDDAAVALANIRSAVASGQPVIDLLEPVLPRCDARHGAMSTTCHQLRLHLLVAYGRLGRFDDADRELAIARRSNEVANAADPVERARFESYASTLLVNEGKLSAARAALEGTQSLWNSKEARSVRPTLVMQRNLAFVLWRMAAEDVDAATARSEDLIRRWDDIAKPGNHASTLMRQQLAIYFQQLGLFGQALLQLEQAQTLTEAAGAEDALTGQLRGIALLEARVLAGMHPGAGHALPTSVDMAAWELDKLDASPLIGDVRMAEALLTLGRVALAPGAGPAGHDLALQIDRRLAALEPVLQRSRQHTSRIALFRARLAGAPVAWLEATGQRVAYFNGLPERQGLPEWIARLQHACALRAADRPWEQALDDAERAMPGGLEQLAHALHPLSDAVAALRAGRAVEPGCDWRF